MNIILPIIIVAIIIGLTTRRSSALGWLFMTLAIILVIGRYAMKN
jgi:uncharacterized membrane protein YphA (DoxX/SURF4 family)